MTEVKAQLNYLRISPRKVRQVADTIKRRSATEAEEVLQFTTKRPAEALQNLLQSAIANATENHDLAKENLHVRSVVVDQGPTLRRFRPRAMGRATEIQKKTSHVTLVLEDNSSTE